MESTLYDGKSFQLLHNATIKARAFVPDSDIEPSAIAEYIVNTFTVSKPEIRYNFKTRMLGIMCPTEGAAISYSIGDTLNWTIFVDSVRIAHNCTVYAKATRDHFNDSELATYDISEFPDVMPKPVIEFDRDKGLVSISCEREDASIRYTTDGKQPTMESTLYEKEPFPFTHNGTIRAISYIEDSDIDPVEGDSCVVNSYRVANPEFSYNFKTRKLGISSTTEDAAIRYSIGDTLNWTVYADSVRIARNCTVYAKATCDHFNDSETATHEISDFPDVMPKPTINFIEGEGVVEITGDREDLKFRYALGGAVPTMESTLYAGKFPLLVNDTIKALAYIEDCDVAPSEVTTEVVNHYKVAIPEGEFKFETRTVKLSCPTDGATIHYRIGVNGEWIDYTDPFTVGRNCTVYAYATFPGYTDSEEYKLEV
ncbi:MAG: chitobiase/beta-hexosaminidase C-terminal domain-containing protein, partial [Muribaculaceae bacterium]|nr:chitobiase/beta-hexosaminidase C-terminal domain-containing protein [Muribaculaceae bacterium]